MRPVINLYKSAYSGLSPATWWLSLVMLINRSGTMVVPFMTLYLTQALHYKIAQAGMIMAIFGLGAICGGVLGGKLTDRFGFYNIQLSALTCGGIMFLVLGQMKSFESIAICTFVLAVLNDAFRPANATAIAQYSKTENRTRSYSLNRLAINLGWAVGGALGGIIASKNFHSLFWIDGLTNIGSAILLRVMLSPSRNSQTPAKKEASERVKTNSAYKDKMYLWFIAMTILFGCTFFQLFAVQPVFFKEQLKLTTFFIGEIMALNGLLIALFEMTLVFTLEKKQKNVRYICVGSALVALSFVVFNIFPGAAGLAVFSTLILTLGEMLAMPFMNSFWISRTNNNNRGQYAGLYTAAWSIAQVLGPYAGTQAVQHYSFRTLWWLVGVSGVVTALGMSRLKTSSKLQENEIDIPQLSASE